MRPRPATAPSAHALLPLLALLSSIVAPGLAAAMAHPMDTAVDVDTNFGGADVGSGSSSIVTMAQGSRGGRASGAAITPISPELISTFTPRLSTRSTTSRRPQQQKQQELQHQFIVDHAEQQLIEDGFLPKPQQQLLDQSIQQQQLLQQSQQQQKQQQQHNQQHQQIPPSIEPLQIQHQFQLRTEQPNQQPQHFLEQLPQEHQQFLEPLPQEHQQFLEPIPQEHQQFVEQSHQPPTSQPPQLRPRAKEISQGRKTSNAASSGGRCMAGFSVRKGLVKPDETTNSGRVYFQDVLTNAGGWVKERQQFEAPCTGLYYFSFNAVSTEKQDFTIALMKDGTYQVTAYGGKEGYQWGANSALLFLNAGEAVYLELQQGGIYEHPYNEAYTTFTGFLVNQL